MNSRAPLALALVAALGGAAFFVLRDPGAPPVTETGSAAPELPAAPAPASPVADLDAAESAAVEADLSEAVASPRSAVEAEASAPEVAAKAAVPTTSPTWVTGRLVDSSGNGIGDAGVELAIGMGEWLFASSVEGAPTASAARSENDGSFRIRSLAEGWVTLDARADGYNRFRKSLQLQSGESMELGELVLERGAILEGTVVGPAGAPVSGARLAVRRQEEISPFAEAVMARGFSPDGVTDENGRFRLAQAPAGEWDLLVDHDEHPRANLRGQAEPGETITGLLIELERGGQIAGRVLGYEPDLELDVVALDAAGQNGRSGGLTFFGSRELERVSVQENGTFLIEGLQEDAEVLLELIDRNGISGIGGAVSEERVPARVGDAGVSLTYRPGWQVSLTVADALTGEPVEDFRFAFGPQFSIELAEPDSPPPFEAGRATFSNLRMPATAWFGGDPSVRIEAQGYEPHDFMLEGEPGGRVDLGRILLDPVPTVSVRVTDRETGRPVEGALVRRQVHDEGGIGFEGGGVRRRVEIVNTTVGASEDEVWSPDSARTNADGVALLDGFPGHTVDFVVAHDDYATGRILEVELGKEPAELELGLDAGGTVLVRVLDEAGAPVSGAEIGHREPGGDSAGLALPGRISSGGSARTNAEGIARFDRLEFGLHGFRVEKETAAVARSIVFSGFDDDDAWEEVDVTDAGPFELDLFLEPVFQVAGVVTEGGAPLAGARVQAKPAEQDGPEFPGGFSFGGAQGERTDENGRYTIEDLEPGDYVLEVSHASRALPAEFPFTLVARSERVDVDLPINAVEGRILDSGGQPLEGVVVSVERAGGPQQVAMFFTMGTGGGASGGVLGADSGGAATTDAEGRYRLEGLPVDEDLRVVADPAPDLGFYTQGKSEVFQVGAEDTRSGVDATCPEGGAIRVLFDFAGEDPAPVLLFARRGEGAPKTQMVEGQAEYLLEGLDVGAWSVSASKIGGAMTIGEGGTEVEVIAGEVVEVTVVP